MFCVSCNTEIPPNWKSCLNLNICPACGGQIMNDEMKTLMEEIREAFKSMENDPEGLASWLLSNYRMQKVGSAEPVEFYGKTKNMPLKERDNKLQQFLKNAGVTPSRQQELANIAKKINEKTDPDQEDFDIDELINQDEDPEFMRKALEVMSKTAKTNHKKLVNYEAEDDDEEELHPALQKERLERLEKQKALNLGGIGKIRRSE